jgi:hypothetical protein
VSGRAASAANGGSKQIARHASSGNFDEGEPLGGVQSVSLFVLAADDAAQLEELQSVREML